MRSPRPASRHGPVAQLLIASSPLTLILVAYAVGDWIDAPIDIGRAGAQVNRLGLGVHLTAAATVDRHVFGVVPSVWLQSRFGGGPVHWYDALATLVYVTHVVGIPLVTALVWFRRRDRYRAWIATVIVFILIGIAGYVLFPAAPPWLASQHGALGSVDRASSLGWDYLHLRPLAHVVGASQASSNPVAAMPSLHAGASMLIALFIWPAVARRWRVASAVYVTLMALTLVYTGEHYVVDVVAGWLTAGAAILVVRAAPGRLSARRRPDPGSRRRSARRSGGARSPRPRPRRFPATDG